jgi:hypothetical protein
MRKLLLALTGLALVGILGAATTASAKQFPNAGCPDTMSVVTLKSLLGGVDPCSAVTGAGTAPGDTIRGVGGIIIGFDEIPTGFDVFIEQSDGQANSGLDVFTGGTNFRAPYGFNLGDSIVVEYGRVANFNGDIELLSPNNTFASPNIVLRKVSSGNPLPPIHDGTTTDFNLLLTNTSFKPWVASLVRLTGPVRIARLVSASLAIVVSDAAPSDSVFIDYFKIMGTNSAPPVGTIISSITAVGSVGTTGWRLAPRSTADIVDALPPSLNDAYAVADNQYRVVFDRTVTSATATNLSNYSLGSFGSVDAAVMDGTRAVILTVSATLAHGDAEAVTANGVTGVANGITMTTPMSSNFLAGVMTTGEMAQPSPDSLVATPCRDYMKYSGLNGVNSNALFGPRASMAGIVTGIFGNLYYMEDANTTTPAGMHRGITVFAPPSALLLGHKYLLAGAGEEFYMEGEFASVQYVLDQGTPGVPASIPLTVAVASYDTCDAAQNIDSGRDYLSELVTLSSVKVVQRYTTPTTTGFHVVGPTSTYADTIYVENQNNVLGAYLASNPNYPALGSLIDVTGVMHFTQNTSTPSFRVCPRTAGDITILGMTGVNPGTGALRFAAYPNPARTVNLSFTLPQATHVELGVYDLFGRRVATLASSRMIAGSYQLAWAGRDDAGNKVHSGVYFYRLKAGSDVRTARTIYIGN